MELPIVKTPEYLSPSSFSEWRQCPLKFYYKRMAGEYIEEPTSIAAGIGSAVDAHICNAVANELGIGSDPDFSLDKMFRESIPEHIRGVCVVRGQRLFDIYKRLGCLRRLMERGIGAVHPFCKKTLSVDGKEVPIYVKPDLFKADGTPIEIKVNGSDSKSGASPHAGYKICYFDSGMIKYSHVKFGESLDNLNLDWAYQLTIYSFGYNGVLPFRKLNFEIENIAVRQDTVACAYIPTFVTAEFAQMVFNQLHGVYDSIKSGNIPPVTPEKSRCYKFNQLCNYSDSCYRYKEVMKDEGRRQVLFG